MGTEEKPGPGSIRDEILAILNMVDKYGYCLNSELEEYADKIIRVVPSTKPMIKLPEGEKIDIWIDRMIKEVNYQGDNADYFRRGAVHLYRWLCSQVIEIS